VLSLVFVCVIAFTSVSLDRGVCGVGGDVICGSVIGRRYDSSLRKISIISVLAGITPAMVLYGTPKLIGISWRL
jgi:hypothetical protein